MEKIPTPIQIQCKILKKSWTVPLSVIHLTFPTTFGWNANPRLEQIAAPTLFYANTTARLYAQQIDTFTLQKLL